MSDLWRNLDSASGFGPGGCGFKINFLEKLNQESMKIPPDPLMLIQSRRTRQLGAVTKFAESVPLPVTVAVVFCEF